MTHLARRAWVPEGCETYIQDLAGKTAALESDAIAGWLDDLATENAAIHDRDCINLNPATNVMNPAAEYL